VRDLHVLDVGCGSGHTAVAFALAGASATGLDISQRMVRHAQQLAQEHGVNAVFVQGQAETLTGLPDGAFDLVFSSYALHYVAQLGRALAACRRVLVDGGRLVIAVEHPLRACFFDDETEELAVFPIRDYAGGSPMRWTFPESDAGMTTYARTLSEWTDALTAAGFCLRRLVEPRVPVEVMDELWPDDGALAPLRNLPHTLILLAEAEPN
jgi:SAM-dependent methyltransferase